MTASKLFDFLGRVLMAAVFVNALPAKFTNFAETAGFIASKGIPEPLASVLLVAAIVVLIAGSILLVFGSNTCLLYTSPSPRDATLSRMPSSA